MAIIYLTLQNIDKLPLTVLTVFLLLTPNRAFPIPLA